MNKYIVAIVIAFSSVGMASAMDQFGREFSVLERDVKAAEALRPSSRSQRISEHRQSALNYYERRKKENHDYVAQRTAELLAESVEFNNSKQASLDLGPGAQNLTDKLGKALAKKASSKKEKTPWYICCSEPKYKVTVVQPAPAVPASAQNTVRSNASDLNTARRSSVSVTPSARTIPKLNLHALSSE